MAMEIDSNEMEGTSIYLRDKTAPCDVPLSHRSLIGPQELLALENLSGYFKNLSRKTSFSPLRRWLKVLAECKRWQLELHSTPLVQGYDQALVRFICNKDWTPAVRLANSIPTRDLPEPLQEIYSIINGTNYFGFGTSGGMEAVGDIQSIQSSELWLSEANTIDPTTCYVFCHTENGNSFCYSHPDLAIYYNHESGILEEIGPLNDILTEMFDGLCDGLILDMEP